MSHNISLEGSILPFGRALVAEGLITGSQLQVLEHESRKTGRNIYTVLRLSKFVSEEKYLQFLQKKYQFKLLKTVASQDHSSLDIIQHLPENIIRDLEVWPVLKDGETVFLIMGDPFDVKALDSVRGYLPKKYSVIPAIAPNEILQRLIATYTSCLSPTAVSGCEDFLEKILQYGVSKGASDIHLMPQEKHVQVSCRIDGVLQPFMDFHIDNWSEIVVRLKVLAYLDVAESRRPQDGYFPYNYSQHHFDCRLSLHPTIYGESIVIRLLEKQQSLKSLETLGFSIEQQHQLNRICQPHDGLVLVIGPTGSGKTTTLYSLLGQLDHQALNVMTLEQPIEYKVSGIRQTEIKEKSGFSFSDGIRSMLRQDPDVMLIGEIRDEETAQMVFRAVMTGHKVFATLHANDVFGIFDRFREFGISESFLETYIHAVIGQRLMRRLCVKCRAPRDPHTVEKHTAHLYNLTIPTDVFEAVGCADCDGVGYVGRIVVAEILEIPPNHGDIKNLQNTVSKVGFKNLDTQLWATFLSGVTTRQEIAKFSKSVWL